MSTLNDELKSIRINEKLDKRAEKRRAEQIQKQQEAERARKAFLEQKQQEAEEAARAKAEHDKAAFRETALRTWKSAGNVEAEFEKVFEGLWANECNRRAQREQNKLNSRVYRPRL